MVKIKRRLFFLVLLALIFAAGVVPAFGKEASGGDVLRALSSWTDESSYMVFRFRNMGLRLSELLGSDAAQEIAALGGSTQEIKQTREFLDYFGDVALSVGMSRGLFRLQFACALTEKGESWMDSLARGALTEDQKKFLDDNRYFTLSNPSPLEGTDLLCWELGFPDDEFPLKLHVAAMDNILLIGFTERDIKASWNGLTDGKEVEFSKKIADLPEKDFFLFNDATFIPLSMQMAGFPYYLEAPFEIGKSYSNTDEKVEVEFYTNMGMALFTKKELENFKMVKWNTPLTWGGALLASTGFSFDYKMFTEYYERMGYGRELGVELEDFRGFLQHVGIAEEDISLIGKDITLVLGGRAQIEGRSFPGFYLTVGGGDPAAAERILKAIVNVMADEGDIVLKEESVPGFEIAYTLDEPATLIFGIKEGSLFAGMIDKKTLGDPAESDAKLTEILDKENFGFLYLNSGAVADTLEKYQQEILAEMAEPDADKGISMLLDFLRGFKNFYLLSESLEGGRFIAEKSAESPVIRRTTPKPEVTREVTPEITPEITPEETPEITPEAIVTPGLENPEVKALVEEGDAAYNEGRYDDAEESYKKALKVEPENSYVLSSLGWVHIDQKRPKDAVADFEKAIEAKPDDAEAYYGMGWAYVDMERYEDAIDVLKKAVDISPEYVEALNDIGYVYEEMNKYEDAIPYLEKAIEVNPEYAIAYNNLGWAHHNLKNYDEAFKAYEKAIENDPEYSRAYYNLAMAHLDAGDKKSAMDVYERLKSFDESSAADLMKDIEDWKEEPQNDEASWEEQNIDLSNQEFTDEEDLKFGTLAQKYMIKINKKTTQSITFDLNDELQDADIYEASVYLDSINRNSSGGIALSDENNYIGLIINDKGEWKIIHADRKKVYTDKTGKYSAAQGDELIPCYLKISLSLADETFSCWLDETEVFSGKLSDLKIKPIAAITQARLISAPFDYKRDYKPPYEAFFNGNIKVRSKKEISPQSNTSDETFSGTWEWEKNSGKSSFILNLTQSGDKLKGSHELVADGGKVVDMSNFKDTIRGSIDEDGVAEVIFTGSYSPKAGKATIELMDDGNLLWEITEKPSKCYFPAKAIMIKKK